MKQALNLTRPQKAAAILVAMGKPSAGRLLKFFKQEELKMLIEAARMLRTIPQADLERIVAEFEAEFAEGAGLLDSADKMDTILSETLSPEEVSAIMGRGGTTPAKEGAPSVWSELERLDPTRLASLLAAEHPQVAALVLTKLAAATASRITVALEKPLRTEIVKRMLAMSAVKPDAMQMVERQMSALLAAEAGGKDTTAGQARIASLLNEMDKSQVDEVIRDLEESGSADVAGIRARLFSFEEIPLLSQKARVALFDGLATDVVTLALRNAPADVVEASLGALGARSRRMIEAELAVGGDSMAADEIARARRRIAATAVELGQRGAIELPSTQAAA